MRLPAAPQPTNLTRPGGSPRPGNNPPATRAAADRSPTPCENRTAADVTDHDPRDAGHCTSRLTGVLSVVARVDVLFKPDPTAQTQFRGVYRRGKLFAARFKINGHTRFLGYFLTERQAAERVAREYESVYGPGWEAWLRGGTDRRRRPWWAVRPWHQIVKRPGKKPIRRVVGYVVSVWEWGRETQLGDHLHPFDRRLDSVRRRPRVFPTWAAAQAAAIEWARTDYPRRWGLLTPYALWR